MPAPTLSYLLESGYSEATEAEQSEKTSALGLISQREGMSEWVDYLFILG